MDIVIIKEPITRAELKVIAEKRFGDMVKAAVDIEQEVLAVGGEFHMDEQVMLFEERGSKQYNVWGINIYPDKTDDEFIQFDSVINLKPNLGNRTRGIGDEVVREKIIEIVDKLII